LGVACAAVERGHCAPRREDRNEPREIFNKAEGKSGRCEMLAPHEGAVMNLKYTTPGAAGLLAQCKRGSEMRADAALCCVSPVA